MKLKEKVSWLMGRMQQQLFTCLEEGCSSPLAEREKRLVNMLELIKIEKRNFLQEAQPIVLVTMVFNNVSH